ncbi:hypothetical protein ABZ329_29575 [Streptomyces rubiginosohelvolus]|uniref:hypothetical protein n=1 Tax=Streptomyces rubiginosohelvolus TaxID=67362 RepID=UPI0033C7A3B9
MTTQPQTAWPENVIARYLTVGGATVSIWAADQWTPVTAACGGCSASNEDGGVNSSDPKRWAQSHAETCRAIPKPA